MNLFPYSQIRPEQDALMQEIRSALENKQHLIVHAPTGLGKTAAALAPALEIALQKGLTVFFLTSRHTQHTIAIETLKIIKEKHSVKFTVADLIGKQHMCLQDGVFALRPGEFHEYCRRLRDENRCEFYSNTKNNSKNTPQTEILITEIKGHGALHTEQLIEHCQAEKLCPYEVATALAKDSAVIITDYSYIFNPKVNASLFRRIQRKLSDCIVIIDEAHNLPKRIVDAATERLTSFMLKRAMQECAKFGFGETGETLLALSDALAYLAADIKKKEGEKLVTKEQFVQLVMQIEDYTSLLNELKGIAEIVLEKQKQSFTGTVAEFLDTWQGEDFGFTRILSAKDNKLSLSYKCLDASLITKDIIKQTYCTIAMSGTLAPTSMYRDMLGFENVVEKVFKSPFPEENKLSLIVPKTTTRFTERNEEQFKHIAHTVAEITNIVPGNSVVFFPSYSIRDQVFKYYSEKTNKTVFLETSEMTKAEKIEMLEKFKIYALTGAVILGTTAGNFSEGIDLLGDLLKCVVIAGLPLQQPDLETQEVIKYFDQKFSKGWDYGYIFPAFNRVLQGAGRCIRSETDRGVIVYLDERYAWPQYIRCFPEDLNLKIKKDYLEEIKGFFSL